MFKKTTFILGLSLITLTVLGQDTKKEAENQKTKMEVFSSKTGTITKFIDTKLPTLKTTYDNAETRVRKITNGVTSAYFYQIIKPGKYSNSTASIEYSDLLEILKAMQTLKQEQQKDLALKADYLENKFVTVDGFYVGYYISEGKTSWYVRLEKYGSDNTLYISNVDDIEKAFTDAKNKIDELKKG